MNCRGFGFPKPRKDRVVLKSIRSGEVVSEQEIGRPTGPEYILSAGHRELDDTLEVLVIFAGSRVLCQEEQPPWWHTE